jgi:uncharacterized membrane protein
MVTKKNKIIVLTVMIITFLVVTLLTIVSICVDLSCHNKTEPNISRYWIDKIPGEKTKNYDDYFISFNDSLILPNYALYYLNGDSSRCPNNPFYADPEFPTRTPTSFLKTGYDRGHLVPASLNVNDSCSTFSMANIVPQIPCFNRQIWKYVEQYVTDTYRNQNILTVPEYDYTTYIYDSNGQILFVPIGFYKIVFTTYIYDSNGQILFVPIGFYKIVFSVNYENMLFSIYLNHTNTTCNALWQTVGDFDKLPYFVTYR